MIRLRSRRCQNNRLNTGCSYGGAGCDGGSVGFNRKLQMTSSGESHGLGRDDSRRRDG